MVQAIGRSVCGGGEPAPFLARTLRQMGICCLCGAFLAGCASDHARQNVPTTGPWRAVIGGMSGAAVGNVVTQYMDSEARELAPLAATQRIDDGIVTTLSNKLLFDFNSADLTSSSHEPLRKMAAVFVKYPKTLLTVTGHTDNIGPVAYNIRLSERRAKAVADFLVDAGVPREQLRIMGLGFERPVATNDSAAGRARNRRVEIHIAPSAALRGEEQSHKAQGS